MEKHTQTSNSRKKEHISFPAGYGNEVSYGPIVSSHSLGGVRRGLEKELHLCLLTAMATSTTVTGKQKGGHKKDICWQFISLAFT